MIFRSCERALPWLGSGPAENHPLLTFGHVSNAEAQLARKSSNRPPRRAASVPETCWPSFWPPEDELEAEPVVDHGEPT